ncbi:MAG: hypothetical protein ACI95C_003014, partial [Pseudohongiellaceae bacterium]
LRSRYLGRVGIDRANYLGWGILKKPWLESNPAKLGEEWFLEVS